jgi:hypothetical protein
MNHNVTWPFGAKFAFSIFDDTDNATVANCKPVYDYLIEKGLLTTKSVWVYPPRGGYLGGSLSDPDYLKWVESIDSAGVEVGLHNVGDGEFSREEIISGLGELRWSLTPSGMDLMITSYSPIGGSFAAMTLIKIQPLLKVSDVRITPPRSPDPSEFGVVWPNCCSGGYIGSGVTDLGISC